MENYWNECEKHTGAATEATAEIIGKEGAWTVKSRGPAKIEVGCLVKAESEFASRRGRGEHIAVCEHGRVSKAVSSRRAAIKEAKRSPSWCAKCRDIVAAL